MNTDWQNYLSWNAVVAEAVYPETDEPRIVFLDLEGDALETIAAAREIDKDSVVPSLVSACRSMMNVYQRTSAFKRFETETNAWYAGNRLDPPPSIALLSIFSLAAEQMERGEGVASHNYYAQLTRILDLHETDVDVGQSYRKVSDALWDSLSVWLTYQEGRRGYPVDFSVGQNRYIGRAKAQALVRDVDRRRFQDFFQSFDLSPGTEIAEDELAELLDVWIRTSRAASTHIRGLWEQPEARPHLVAAAQNTLSTWDGHLTNRHKVGVDASRLRIVLARRRLRRGIDLGVSLNVPDYEQPRSAVLNTSDGDVEVQLEPGRPGELRVVDIQGVVEAESLLEGIVKITDDVAGSLKRVPRDVIVLREDPFEAIWHEVSQVRLGDAVTLLVRESVNIDQDLSDVSGSTWTKQVAADLPGLPLGWCLIEGVTVVAQPSRQLGAFDDLRALVPITQTAFDFTGGVPFPIGHRIYHLEAPPVVTIGTGGNPFTVTLFDLDDDHPLQISEPWESAGEPLSISISELDLDAGEYGFIVRSPDGKAKEREFTLVRSGEVHLDIHYESLVHAADTGLGALSADNNPEADLAVQGVPLFEPATAKRSERGDDHGDLARIPWWRPDQRPMSNRVLTAFPTPPPDSCMRTNAHVETIEQATLDHRMEAIGISRGVCKGCGRVQQYSNNYWRNYKKWQRGKSDGAASSHRALPRNAKTRSLGSSVGWDVAFDMVMALEGGDANLLRRLTRRFDPSAGFFHEFVATLEGAGHIEILRDASTFELVAWEVAPTTIVECGDHRRLSGYWPAPLLTSLGREGIKVDFAPQATGPSVHTTASSAEDVLDVIPDAFVSRNPALSLASRLPPLSEVLSTLPRRPLPGGLNFERYMPGRDSWAPVSVLNEPGGYRNRGYRREYFLLLDSAEPNAVRVSSALAKHAAALLDKERALIAYSTTDRELIVPLGAPVPGLYGRALGLASGRTRQRRDAGGAGSFESYPEVPVTLARTIQHLLES